MRAFIKKSRLILLILIVTILFFAIQFTLKSNLNEKQSIETLSINKSRLIFDKLNGISNKIKQKRSQIKIPLDQNNQPELRHQLPFFNRLNQVYNFSLYYIEEPSEVVKDKKKFVDIESENRIVQRSLIKKYDFDLAVGLENVKGINKNKVHLYKPDSNGFFKCLNSNQQILYSNFNDDYCDCIDGTDEPSSSACHFSIFYCSIQNEFLSENFIVSSRVDDNICDCCDGSDESSSLKCTNTCDAKIAEVRKQLEKKKNGQGLKRKYLVDGLFKNEQLYGPQGVFFSLSKSCYEIDRSEYTFEVCPFKKATQYKRNQKSKSTNIGRTSVLVRAETQSGKMWILKMNDGDSINCSQPRRCEIRFICGNKDELKQVQEPSKCVYEFEFITPAAC